MRNIIEYPVTREEKVKLIKGYITFETNLINASKLTGKYTLGDMNLTVLNEILKDYNDKE